MEEYETGWQSDIITDELGIVYLHNHFHGDCAKVGNGPRSVAGSFGDPFRNETDPTSMIYIVL